MASESESPKAGVATDTPSYLIIVARERPDLYWYLNENLADYANVQVVLDRREGDPGPAGPPARDLAGAWVAVRRQQPGR
jgi:hypothetical protein